MFENAEESYGLARKPGNQNRRMPEIQMNLAK